MNNKIYHHENLREKLIESGIKIINEYGYKELSLRKIAKYCGVSHSAPYRHFNNKEELLNEMQDYVEEKFVEILEKSIKDYKDDSMMEFGKAYVMFFYNNPQYYKFFTNQKGIIVDFTKDYNKIKSNYKPFIIFKEEAIRLFKGSNIKTEKYTSILMGMWAKVHGLAGMATMEGVKYYGNWDILTEEVLQGSFKDE